MLSGTQLGKARQQTKLVADRLKHNLKNRPLGLVWSKSDINLDEEVKMQISDHIQNSPIPNFQDFETSVRNETSTDLQLNILRSEEHTSELQSLMRISYAVFC